MDLFYANCPYPEVLLGMYFANLIKIRKSPKDQSIIFVQEFTENFLKNNAQLGTLS